MKAIIMAGGEGSRLRPLTCDRPKPMVPVMDRPIMQHIVELLYRHNFAHVGATLMYLPEDIKDFFGDGSDFGIKMQYFVEESPLGTAGSVKNAQEFLDDTFLVISGDALTDFDLSAIMDFHKTKKAAVTIVLTRVPNPLEYGVVITDADGCIKQFLEKPSWGEVFSDTVNTGIYVIEPEILNFIPPATSFDFSKDLFPLLLRQGYPIFGCVMPGYWCDIGNLSQYQQAHYDILAGRTGIVPGGAQLAPGIWVGKGAEIHEEARLESPAFIGQDVKIGKDACVGSFSVIGANSILDEGVSLKRSIIWNNVYLGKKVTLRGASVCNRVKIKSHAAVYEEAVIGDDTVLDSYTAVKPGVKIWPHKTVGKGTILKESLIWAENVKKNLFGANGVSGTINVDITPEVAVRLGAAFGSCSKKEGQVTVTADGYPCAQMIKNALAVGLLSTGCHVLDLGKTVTPVSRYGVRTLGVHGGMHVSTMDHGEKVCITFFDRKGANISKSEERKIENAFFREDFRRVTGTQVPNLNIYPDIVSAYYEDLIKSVDVDQLKSFRLRIFVDYDPVNFGAYLPGMLEKLGCEVILSERIQNETLLKYDGKWQRDQVLHLKCDLGVVISSDGEYLVLIDSNGTIIQEDLFTALVSLILLKTNTPCTVVIPVTASQVIEQMARQYQGTVIRTKTARQFFMEKVLSEQMSNSQTGYQQFSMQFDAIHAFVNILEYLAKEKTTLSVLIGAVPEFYVSRREIECPWDAKGTVMRRLIEEHERETELLDGVKVRHENGWALVLPDSDEPVCRIFSEGTSMEVAEELTAMYADKVNNYRKE
ncbi:mannose-1-phosphate guanyltransferase [Candidatus Formimonas warabiya]|uniref:NTP transferase domain-containing protein n=1 Tax=Formimonas warabiya TaxID=1761012 RepID=A0A3G1KM01_FORW1|nr:mannose-1-phosphate guanyltransferase [Candidatus Formimonas warabiya]ATW23462.1 hypothetical protein DCMF_00410 [Candidatus Formimonas warabiya]